MPWREQKIMDQREEFVLRSLSGEVAFSRLSKEYNIPRKTGYKWKNIGRPGCPTRAEGQIIALIHSQKMSLSRLYRSDIITLPGEPRRLLKSLQVRKVQTPLR